MISAAKGKSHCLSISERWEGSPEREAPQPENLPLTYNVVLLAYRETDGTPSVSSSRKPMPGKLREENRSGLHRPWNHPSRLGMNREALFVIKSYQRNGPPPRATTLLAFAMSLLAMTAVTVARESVQFEFRGSVTGPGGTFDLLADGRVVAVVGDSIVAESSRGSGVYYTIGSLPEGSISPFGASFLAVSPDGSRIAIGDGGFGAARVHVINTADLNGGPVTPYSLSQENYSATWIDGNRLAVSYGNPSTFFGEIAVVDIVDASSKTIITVGGASAGIAIDNLGNFITGNGFDYLPGYGSSTGEMRAFTESEVNEVLRNGSDPLDFESRGMLLGGALSAGSLEFDEFGNLFVGGADFGTGQVDFFALFTADQYADALLGVDPLQVGLAFVDDPSADPFSSYIARYNAVTDEWLVSDFGNFVLYRYGVIPVPGSACLLSAVAAFLIHSESCRRRKGVEGS